MVGDDQLVEERAISGPWDWSTDGRQLHHAIYSAHGVRWTNPVERHVQIIVETVFVLNPPVKMATIRYEAYSTIPKADTQKLKVSGKMCP